MAVIYQKQQNGHRYEVRSAGQTRRLYTDGVFHSQYNPAHGVTGSVWDLLFLPSLFRAPGSLRRVLVLGVGGGAVIHMLNRFAEPETIVGVELNKLHLQIARQHFDLRYRNLQLIHANAISWLIEYDGEPFDLIIDDLYGEDAGEPCRAIEADGSWFDVLLENLSESGMLVMNFVNQREWKHSGYFSEAFVPECFASVLRFTTPTCHNAVVAFSRQPVVVRELRQNLRQHPVLDDRSNRCRLRYRISRIA